VQVFHHQDQGLLLRGVQNQVPQQRKGPGAPRLGTAPHQVLRGHREVQELQHQGHVVRRGNPTCMQPVLDGGGVDR